MLIDWFTVGAQVLNFVVLVWLLKRFLYKPVLKAIDAREKRITAESSAADAKAAQAQTTGEELARKIQVFDAERSALLAKAREEAQDDRARLLKVAQKDIDNLQLQRAAAMQNEKTSLEGAIKHLAAAEVYAVARKALADLASSSLEERMIETFTRRLKAMEPEAAAAFRVALADAPEGGIVRTGFDLPAQARTTLQNALNETFSAAIKIQFITDTSIICGVEATVKGQRVAWSIADYLSSLAQQVDALFDAAAEPEPVGTTPGPEARALAQYATESPVVMAAKSSALIAVA